MQLNPGSSAGLVDDTHFICQTDATAYPLADIVRNMNRHYYKAVVDIIKIEGRMQWDDSANLNSLPEYTFTLVDGQQQYALPTNLLKLWAVEVTDSTGDAHRLQEIDINDPAMADSIADFEDTEGVPRFYEIRGENIFLYPAPNTADMTMTDGGKMYFSREVDAFTAADTTQEPGFAEPFHRILSIGAAVDWLMVNDTSKVDRWRGEYEQLRSELREFYSTRNKEVKARLTPFHRQSDYV